MTWMILAFALHVEVGQFASEVRLPPPSSSPVPNPAKRFDDVKFAQLLNVPHDILLRLPADEADHIAKQARAGKAVYLSNTYWLT